MAAGLPTPRIAALISAIFCGGSLTAFAQPTAIIVSGGGDPTANYCRYYTNIERSEKVLANWRRSSLVAGGPNDPGPNAASCDSDGDIRYTPEGLLQIEHKVPVGHWAGPATLQGLEERIGKIKPGEPLLLYVTDHGTTGNGIDDRRIALWGETLTVPQLRKLLSRVPADNKVVLVNDQCFGGGMLDALFEPGSSEAARPHSCGFAAATAAESAYDGGGYMARAAELAGETNPKKAEAQDFDGDGQYSFSEIQRSLRQKGETKSTPISSSDLFLQRYISPVFEQSTSIKTRSNEILADCLFTQDGFKSLTSGMSAPLAAVLQVRLEQLKADIQNDYGIAKIPKNATFDQMTQAYEKKEAEAQEAEKKFDATRPLFLTAFEHWLRDQGNPALVKKMEEDGKRNLMIAIELGGQPTPQRRAELESEAVRIRESIAREQDEVHRYLASAKIDAENPIRKSFIDYAKTHGNHPPSDEYPADIAALRAQTGDKMDEVNKTLQPYRRLKQSMMAYNAIRSMINRQDTAKMSHYLDLLDCENTPVFPVPGVRQAGK